MKVQNPRSDRFIPVAEKIRKEAIRVVKQFNIPSSEEKIVIEEMNELLSFPSLEEAIEKYKNNFIYSFMLEAVAMMRIQSTIERDVTSDFNYSDENELERLKEFSPYLYSIIKKRKFEKLIDYVDALYDQGLVIFTVVDHLDDMLQNRNLYQLLKREGKLPTPTMTLPELEQILGTLTLIEEEADKKAGVSNRALKEVEGLPAFSDPLHGKPPVRGVISKGETFLSIGDKFKWVDITKSSVDENLLNDEDTEFALNAPYEAFYVRHCGRDSGSKFLSLRVKIDNGWYPIAMATLVRNFDDSDMENNPDGDMTEAMFSVTQLKSYKNNRYYSLSSEAVKWLADKGVTPTELKGAILKLLLDKRIMVERDNDDIALIELSKVSKKLDEKLLDHFRKFGFQLEKLKDNYNLPVLIVGALADAIRETNESELPNTTLIRQYLKDLFDSSFVKFLKEHIPSYPYANKVQTGRLLRDKEDELQSTIMPIKFPIMIFPNHQEVGKFYEKEGLTYNHFAQDQSRFEHRSLPGLYREYARYPYDDKIKYVDDMALFGEIYINLGGGSSIFIQGKFIEMLMVFKRRWEKIFLPHIESEKMKNPVLTLKDKEEILKHTFEDMNENVLMYYVEKSNFFAPEGFFNLSLYRTPEAVEQMTAEGSKILLPFFFPSGINRSGNFSHFWKQKGKHKDLIAAVQGIVKDDKIIVEFMSVKSTYRRKKVMTFMIDYLKKYFKKDKVEYIDLTKDGEKFVKGKNPVIEASGVFHKRYGKIVKAFHESMRRLKLGEKFLQKTDIVQKYLVPLFEQELEVEVVHHFYKKKHYVEVNIFHGIKDSSVGAKPYMLYQIIINEDGKVEILPLNDVKEFKKDFGKGKWYKESMEIIDSLVRELIVKKNPNKIPGGKADKYKPTDFDEEKLRQGALVEMEHTDDPAIAQEIAMDHLVEDIDYYDKLKLVHNPIKDSEFDKETWGEK